MSQSTNHSTNCIITILTLTLTLTTISDSETCDLEVCLLSSGMIFRVLPTFQTNLLHPSLVYICDINCTHVFAVNVSVIRYSETSVRLY